MSKGRIMNDFQFNSKLDSDDEDFEESSEDEE